MSDRYNIRKIPGAHPVWQVYLAEVDGEPTNGKMVRSVVGTKKKAEELAKRFNNDG